MRDNSGCRVSSFRFDINGLRAWAVLGVVLYHFRVPGFSGGFAGVDVFFVISGFLMTSIVVGGLDAGRFTLFGFYMARARRILPALLVLAITLLGIGWFLLMPEEYRSLAKHARDSLLFSSNLRYLAEAGYFDSASHEKWMLHTWSLSVEWQFYLLYPVFVVGLRRITHGRRLMLLAHALVLLASFVTCQILGQHADGKAFFLLQARAWELLCGGMVFLLGENKIPMRLRGAAVGLGGVLIALSFFLVTPAMRWPGSATLLPVIGGCLILLAHQDSSWIVRGKVFQWLGSRSYSIYLWHWPLVVFLVYFEVEEEPLWIVSGIAVSFVLGSLSYSFVENPARRIIERAGGLGGFVIVSFCIFAAAIMAQQIRKNGGFPLRLPAEVARIEAERNNRNTRGDKCFEVEANCVYGGPQVAALVLGDSHANALINAIAASVPKKSQGVYFRGAPGCLLVFSAKALKSDFREQCDGLKKDLVDNLSGIYPDVPLIVIQRASYYAFGENEVPGAKDPGVPRVYFSRPFGEPSDEYLKEFKDSYIDSICRMADRHPVYLVRPIPEMLVMVPQALGRAMLLGRKSVEVSLPVEKYRQRNKYIFSIQDEAAKICGAHILDPAPYLCDDEKCYGSRDGKPLYMDFDHLTEFGNRILSPMFYPVFGSG